MNYLLPYVSQINEKLDSIFGLTKLHGICLDIFKDDKLYKKELGNDAIHVYPEDGVEYFACHTLLDTGDFTQNKDRGFGSKGYQMSTPMGLIVFSSIEDAFDKSVSVLQGLAFVQLTTFSFNHNRILYEEFGTEPKESRLDLEKFHLFTLRYTIVSNSKDCLRPC